VSYITFLIQGRITQEGLDSISRYSPYGNVVVSCWNDDKDNIISSAKKLGAKVVVNEMWPCDKYNFQNIRYHLVSTLSGLKQVDSKFVIKLRGDEYYENILPIIDSLLSNPCKMTTSNIFFRGKGSSVFIDGVKSYSPPTLFHPSDHIMGTNTEALKYIFEKTVEKINTYSCNQSGVLRVEELGLSSEYCFPYVTAEALFCIFYLQYKGIDVLKSVSKMSVEEVEAFHKKIITENYSLVRVSRLGNFLCRFNSNPNKSGPKFFTDEESMLNCVIKSITSFDEL
jgi:hypothetical protein